MRKRSKNSKRSVLLAKYFIPSHTVQDPDAFERQYAIAVALESAPVRGSKKTKKDAEGSGLEDDSFTTVGKGGKAMQYTADGIFKNLQLVQEARGKKVLVLRCKLLVLV
jgi:hypothetical protein